LSEIRVTYTGLLSFAVAIITAIAGTAFTLILTRSLTQQEFGTWGLIGGITQYVIIFSTVIAYWSTRDTARKIDSGKTAIMGNVILSVTAMIVYILISYFLSSETKTDFGILLFSVILIPVMFFGGLFTAITLGWKPHVISYGLLGSAISQIIFSFLFVYYLDYGVNGVIMANFISHLINSMILLKYSYHKIVNKINSNYLKKWFKLSWIPLYPSIPILIGALGISIYSVMTGSVTGLSFWTASIAVSAIVAQVAVISKGVYPKLLEEKDTHYLRDNVSQLFFFNFLVTGIIVVFAKPALYALNPVYVDAYFVAIILAINNFFSVISVISFQNLEGIEKIDLDKNTTIKNYMKSYLFYPHTLRLIQTSASTIILVVGFAFLINSNTSEIDLLIFWALTVLFTQIPISLSLFKKMVKTIQISLNYKAIMKYGVITLCANLLIFLIIDNYLVYESELFSFIPNLLFFFSIGIGLFIGISYITDKQTRELLTSIIKEIKPDHS
jgi:hypothetical protein